MVWDNEYYMLQEATWAKNKRVSGGVRALAFTPVLLCGGEYAFQQALPDDEDILMAGLSVAIDYKNLDGALWCGIDATKFVPSEGGVEWMVPQIFDWENALEKVANELKFSVNLASRFFSQRPYIDTDTLLQFIF